MQYVWPKTPLWSSEKEETILILISSNRYFIQYLTYVFLNFKEAL